MKKEEISLSPSKLVLFKECPRCFFFEMKNKIRRPRGIFSSLPSGIDSTIKKYFDKNRDNGLPLEVAQYIEGTLVDQKTIDKMRSPARFFFTKKIKGKSINFSGAIDDCVVYEKNNKKIYCPIDFKTRGFPTKEETSQLYQLQLDCYALLLKEQKYEPGEFAYLIYFFPEKFEKFNLIKFAVQVEKVEISHEKASKTLEEAVSLLLQSEIPEPGEKCDFCRYRELLKNY
ncbi:MAG: PD-(D/E)XK nuclease family protein [Candidatus Pacearchaeota archaeon]